MFTRSSADFHRLWKRIRLLMAVLFVVVTIVYLIYMIMNRPNKDDVRDMCLFADIVKDFSRLETCVNRPESKRWEFRCKQICYINTDIGLKMEDTYMVTIATEKLKSLCTYEIVDSVTSYSHGDFCLLDAIQNQCMGGLKVPNIVHYVWLGNRHEFKFHNFLSVYSVYKYQKPCLIIFHGETLPFGAYWEKVLGVVKNIVHMYRKSPDTIYNKTIKYVEHKADIVRLETLKEYGGIYLDTDTILLKPLEPLRHFSYSMSQTRNNTLGNGLILSERHAQFVDIWLKHYATFNASKWGEHSVYLPFNLSKMYPEHIHVENRTFLHGGTLDQLFMSNFKWSHLYAIHLYIRYYTKCPYNEHVIGSLNTTMGSIARYVLFGSKELCSNPIASLTDAS